RGLGEHPADLIERPGIGRGCRPRVLPDRRGIDLDYLADAAEVEAADVPGQCRSAQQRPRGRDQAVQDEGGLAGPDGPASGGSRRTGRAAVRSCRLYRSPISMAICRPPPARAGRSPGTAAAQARDRPMIERASVSSWAGVPWAITVPPLAPAPGPS